MDPLSGLLQGPRAQGAFVLRMVMEPPWAVRVQDRAPLTVVAVLSGEIWVMTDEGRDARRIGSGEVGVVQGPDPYVLADRPDSPIGIVVNPGNACQDLDGTSLVDAFSRGVRTWGNDPKGRTVVLVGTYEHLADPGRRLLAELPTLAVVDGRQIHPPVVDTIAEEVARDAPGQQVVLDRLLDLLTVSALRAWFDQAGAAAPGWWRATEDPVVGPALRLLQHNPVHPWTVVELASEVGVSRATLARRFTDMVGQPPMAFLSEWRLALAADLLDQPDATVQGVAAQVGYSTGFALSAAFKRVRGMSPTAYRSRLTLVGAGATTGDPT